MATPGDDGLRNAIDPIVRLAAVREHALESMKSADDLLAGLSHEDGYVRCRVVDRLIDEFPMDPRTVPRVLSALAHEDDSRVRDSAALGLYRLPFSELVEKGLRAALEDRSAQVRWSAAFSLFQLGLGPEPGEISYYDD